MASAHADSDGNASSASPVRRRFAWPRGARIASLSLLLMLVPGVLAGGSPLAAGQAFLFFVGWVLLPGLALASCLAREEDELMSAGMGLVHGTILIGLFTFVCRATGAFGALYAWPLVAPALWLTARRSTGVPSASAPDARGTWLFLAVLVVLFLRVPTGLSGPVDEWYLMQRDLLFHGGNAAELLNEGALTDPRVAGRPLNYHLLSHALAAAASVVTGESIADLFRFWFLGFYPLALAMLLFALARALARSAWAGLIAALVVALHHDLGPGLIQRPVDTAWGFASHLNLGVFMSPTTCFGLALLTAMARVLSRWAHPGWPVGPRAAAELGLLVLGATLAKGSVMPVAIAAAGFAFLVQTLRSRRWSGRWFLASLVMLVAAAPATLYLSFGPGSYAGAMFRLAPWATPTSSRMGIWLLKTVPLFRRTPAWLDGLLLMIPWLPAFLGMGGIGVLAWLAAGRPYLGGIGAWILGAGLAGLGAGVMLVAPGLSQLFFAYNAQCLFALPAGVGAVELWRRGRGASLVFALLALPWVASGVAGIVRELNERVRVAHEPPPLWSKWCEGAAWLRENTGRQALLVARDDGLLLTQFAERRVVVAESPYTPEAHATRWTRVDGQWRAGKPVEDPFLPLQRACAALLRKGDAASLARLRGVSGHEGELYLVRDEFEVNDDIRELTILEVGPTESLDSSPVLEQVFRNAAVAIYRAVE